MWEGSYTFKIVHHIYSCQATHNNSTLYDSGRQSVVHEITFNSCYKTPKKLLSILIFHKICDLHSSAILHSV
jgi:hypothetical protein